MEILTNDDGTYEIKGITQQELEDIIGTAQYGALSGSHSLMIAFDNELGVQYDDEYFLDKYYVRYALASDEFTTIDEMLTEVHRHD